jgi:hypothetical protein
LSKQQRLWRLFFNWKTLRRQEFSVARVNKQAALAVAQYHLKSLFLREFHYHYHNFKKYLALGGLSIVSFELVAVKSRLCVVWPKQERSARGVQPYPVPIYCCNRGVHCKKGLAVFLSPSLDVTNKTLPRRKYLN